MGHFSPVKRAEISAHPSDKILEKRSSRFHEESLTGVGRCKLPKQQRLLINSCLGSVSISVSARAEIFHVI